MLPEVPEAVSCPAIPAITQALAASAFAIHPGTLASRSKLPRVETARQAAAYLAHVGFGLTYAAVGRGISRHRSTVRHACARIEDRRDCDRLDRALTALEATVRHHARTFARLARSAEA